MTQQVSLYIKQNLWHKAYTSQLKTLHFSFLQTAHQQATESHDCAFDATNNQKSPSDWTENMSEFVLTYFPLRGRGEPIRLVLAGSGARWTEDVIQLSDWFSGKCALKKEAVFGQLPQFRDGELVLYQSNAILRYLGCKFGIAGSNDQETALIDMINDGVEDLRLKYSRFMFYEFETGKEKYEKDLSNQLSAFERILSKNSNGTKFLVGDKISYADYNLLDILHCHLDIFPNCLSSFPLLTAFIDRISSRSDLSDYLKSEERKSRPILPKRS